MSKNFFDSFTELDQLVLATPSEDVIQKFVEIIQLSEVTTSYGFSQLQRTDWISALKSKGFFSAAPYLTPDENGKLRGTHIWPQADYLKRMAKKDDRIVQEQVLEIMLEVGKTNNYFIHSHFAEAALAMPPDLAAKWAEHEVEWLKAGNDSFSMLEEGLGNLASYLAKNGRIDTALMLIKELLAILKDPEAQKKQNPEDESEKILCSTLEPRIRCEKYYYEQILQNNIPDLANADAVGTLAVLLELLNDAIVLSFPDPDNTESDEDQYVIRRSAIENSEQNYEFYFQHHLVNATRDIAENICKNDPEALKNLVTQLEAKNWSIFRRLALLLIRINENPPKDFLEERMVNERYFSESVFHHEYFHLLKEHFDKISPAGQKKIIDWIVKGEFEKQKIEKHLHDKTPEQKEKWLRLWQYRKLVSIHEYLQNDIKSYFKDLEKEFKYENDHPDFLVWHWPVRMGSESPKTPDDLAAMSMDELIQYLKDWKPEGKWMGPTPNGLGSALNELITKAPDKFLEHIDDFMDRDIDPTYIRHLIGAFYEICEEKHKPPFEKIFKLCKWVMDNSRQRPEKEVPEDLHDDIDMDTDFKQARHAITRLFEDRVFKDEAGLPFEMREEAWAILEPLTEDTDPGLDIEEKYGGNNMDPLHLSINHTRGKALHAVMHYAMWLCRKIKEREDRKATLDDMPEVRTVLEKHLDTKKQLYGMCKTDRAVYGQWLPQIVHVGMDWVNENLERIFPSDPQLRPLREAAWNTYLLYSRQLYHHVTRLLINIYHEEILALKNKKIDEDTYKSPETRLAEHVAILYLWGECELEKDSLIYLLFETAPEEIIAHTLDYLGRDTHGKNRIADPRILERMKELWEWRVKHFENIDEMPKKELSTFGWWFAGGQFDNVWAFKWLEEALKRTGVNRSNLYVFQRMSKVFAEFPAESLRCLELFMEKNEDPWFFSGRIKEGVWSVLEQAMQYDNPKIKEHAEEIIHRLGAKGYLEYRELLKKTDK